MHSSTGVLAFRALQRDELPGNDLEELMGTRVLFALFALLFIFLYTVPASRATEIVTFEETSHCSGIWKSDSNPTPASHETNWVPLITLLHFVCEPHSWSLSGP